MKPDLIIFDCDGVLVDSEIVGCRVLADYLCTLDLAITPSDCSAKFIGLSALSIREAVEDMGCRTPDDFVDHIRAETLSALSYGVEACPGVEAFLTDDLTSRCVASSGMPEKISQSLRLSGLDAYFGSDVFSASQVRNSKPAPDLFIYASERMAVDPSRAVVVDDSVAGVKAGVAAGMAVVGYCGGSHCAPNHGARLVEHGAAATIQDMTELRDFMTAC